MQGTPTAYWGKLDKAPDGAVRAWLPLEDHCADVAACVEALLKRTLLRKRLAALGGLTELSEAHIARLGYMAVLHDLGKFCHGFQDKSLPNRSGDAKHVSEMLSFYYDRCPMQAELRMALRVERNESWSTSDEAFHELLSAAFCHHGRPEGVPSSFNKHHWIPRDGIAPMQGVERLARWAEEWFPEAFGPVDEPLPSLPAFQHAFSGLVMLADWLGSDRRTFSFEGPTGQARMAWSRSQARRALAAIGIDPAAARATLGDQPVTFAAVSEHEPRDLQAKVLTLPVEEGGSLDILEAETGAGKTEAAIARYLHLFQAGLVDGMYFALPTRTAATQIHGRVVEAIERAFPDKDSRPPVTLAVPGYLRVDEQDGKQMAGFEVLWNDDTSERMRYRGWAAENSKRYLAGPIVVGTIDQVLMSALAIGHSHMRATALLRQFLVVDEVHASDEYMTSLLELVLAKHFKAGGHAFLMSATLGSTARERYLALFASGKRRRRSTGPSLEEASAFPYPVISYASKSEGAQTLPVLEPSNPKQIRTQLMPWADHPQEIALKALSLARQGARVLVIRNTVGDCLETQRAVEALAAENGEMHLLFRCNGQAAPHHARFAREDRTALDLAIEAALGKNATSNGVVVVATQTVQQSLDLDADFLLTDLCPMDVLLQRLGRLHRHNRATRPPGCEAPAPAIILMPSESDLGSSIQAKGEARGSHGMGTVYDDLRILEATRQVLEREPEITVPAHCRRLVELTTHPDALKAIVEARGGAWTAHQIHVTGKWLANGNQAGINAANWDGTFLSDDILFPSKEMHQRITSRLGEADRLIEFAPAIPGPFGHPVQSLTLPSFYAQGLATELLPDEIVREALGFSFRFGKQRYRYDRLGLQQLKTTPRSHDEDLADA